MTSAEYLAKRIARIRAEIAATRERSVRALGKTHPSAEAIAAELVGAAVRLDNAETLLGLVARADVPTAPDPVRWVFIAVGKDAGRDIYAQDAAGTVWALAAHDGIARAHRFQSRDAAEQVAQKRGGYAYPIPV